MEKIKQVAITQNLEKNIFLKGSISFWGLIRCKGKRPDPSNALKHTSPPEYKDDAM